MQNKERADVQSKRACKIKGDTEQNSERKDGCSTKRKKRSTVREGAAANRKSEN